MPDQRGATPAPEGGRVQPKGKGRGRAASPARPRPVPPGPIRPEPRPPAQTNTPQAAGGGRPRSRSGGAYAHAPAPRPTGSAAAPTAAPAIPSAAAAWLDQGPPTRSGLQVGGPPPPPPADRKVRPLRLCPCAVASLLPPRLRVAGSRWGDPPPPLAGRKARLPRPSPNAAASRPRHAVEANLAGDNTREHPRALSGRSVPRPHREVQRAEKGGTLDVLPLPPLALLERPR